jgi:hypothetical protein
MSERRSTSNEESRISRSSAACTVLAYNPAVPVILIRGAEPNAPDHSSVNVCTEPARESGRAATGCVKRADGRRRETRTAALSVVAGNR